MLLALLLCQVASSTLFKAADLYLQTTSFTSVYDFRVNFNVARLLEEGNMFIDDSGDDLIEIMRSTLHLTTRRDAVDYFMAHNRDEIDTAIVATLSRASDPVVAILMSQSLTLVHPRMVAPIIRLVTEYIDLLHKPCLIDHLPSYFEDPVHYAAMFKPIDRDMYRVTMKDEGGAVLGILHDEVIEAPFTDVVASTWNSSVVSIHRTSEIDGNRNHTRLVDLRAGCAVDVVGDYGEVSVISSARIVTAWNKEADHGVMWRGDEGRRYIHDMIRLSQDGSLLMIPVTDNDVDSWMIVPTDPKGAKETKLLPSIDGLGPFKGIRVFNISLLNGSIEEMILFNDKVELFMVKLYWSLKYKTRRELVGQGDANSRQLAEHTMSCRILSAWRVLRTMSSGWEYLLNR